MDNEIVGALIARLRKEKNLTQKEIAEQLNITEQAVSRWERGVGLPDISSLTSLAQILGVDIGDLLEGELTEKETGEGKLKNIRFYVCPICENIIFSSSKCTLSCCGRTLSELVPQPSQNPEEIKIETVDYEWFITSGHPMSKDNYISFSAVVNEGKAEIFSHYPEWNYQLRISPSPGAKLFWYSRKEGLKFRELTS